MQNKGIVKVIAVLLIFDVIFVIIFCSRTFLACKYRHFFRYEKNYWRFSFIF